MIWSVAEAKQRLSKLLRSAAKEPQRIFKRSRPVAVVVAPELYEEFEAWRAERSARSVADAFAELRELSAREGYVLRLSRGKNRRDSFTSSLT